ncbi:hypothetical protein PSE_4357 [Pseudovibrio sp. FO-BEG1]|nr:hypothetical protein PSE_4357 [Pseudovibrio sp. FO-BEG1]
MEARRLLRMEGTAGPIVALSGLRFASIPGYTSPHHVRKRNAVANVIKEELIKAHSSP